MSKQERDAILMGIRDKHEDLKKTLVALKQKAEDLGGVHERLGRALMDDPGSICFDTAQPVSGTRIAVYQFNREQLSIAEVVKLAEDVHQTEIEIDDCRRKLAEAGLGAGV